MTQRYWARPQIQSSDYNAKWLWLCIIRQKQSGWQEVGEKERSLSQWNTVRFNKPRNLGNKIPGAS